MSDRALLLEIRNAQVEQARRLARIERRLGLHADIRAEAEARAASNRRGEEYAGRVLAKLRGERCAS